MRKPRVVIKVYRGLVDEVISDQKIKAVVIDCDEPKTSEEVITKVDRKLVSKVFKRIKEA